MKNFIIPLVGLLLFTACEQENTDRQETIPADQVTPEDRQSPFEDLGIRYDGHYREETRGVVYLIRFFPQGNAVLVNGTPGIEQELLPHLTQQAVGDPVIGWYNVPVQVRGDSIFFKTYPEKGEISYRGNVPSTSTVRLLRHSHINGTEEIKEYIFQPEGSGQ